MLSLDHDIAYCKGMLDKLMNSIINCTDTSRATATAILLNDTDTTIETDKSASINTVLWKGKVNST